MEAKIVVGTKTGKSYNLEAKEDSAAVFIGKRIGDTVNLTPLGLKGYEAKITGGSDKSGFPMRGDLHIAGRGKALMSTRTVGYKPDKEGIRVRKTVVGDVINDEISQINTVVVKAGKDSVEKLIGLGKKEEGEAAEGEAPKEAPKKKPEPPKEEAKEEAPKEVKEEKPPEETKKEEPPKEESKEEKPAEKEAPKEEPKEKK